MKIKFRYSWYDEEKTVLHYIAEEDWNWRDWHAGWRPAAFSLMQHPGDVHVAIDFREQKRPSMPRGINAHLMSFGTEISPKLSGKAVVIGLPQEALDQLMLDDDGTLETRSGRMYFARGDEEARVLFSSFSN